MSYLCNFCGRTATTKSNLKKHQQTVRCLEYQQNPISIRHDCEYCHKSFTTKENLNRHAKDRCKIKISSEVINSEYKELKEENINLKQENIRLKTKLEFLEESVTYLKQQLQNREKTQENITLAAIAKPTTSVKNTIKNAVIQNLLPIKEDEMKEHVSFLTLEHIKEGAEGYAKFALERPLKDRITCTDVSRKKLAWKSEAGEIIYDTEGQALCKKFFAVIHVKSEKLFRELIKELGERLANAYELHDQEEADAIVELTDKVQTWRREAFQASKGNVNELTFEFASYLCKMSARG